MDSTIAKYTCQVLVRSSLRQFNRHLILMVRYASSANVAVKCDPTEPSQPEKTLKRTSLEKRTTGGK